MRVEYATTHTQGLVPHYFFPISLSQHAGQIPTPSYLLCCGSVQFSSVAQLHPTLWPHGLQLARPPCLSPTPKAYSNSCPLSWWSNHLMLCCPLLLLLSIFPSFRVFSNKSVLHIRWPKYWSFSFSISPSNEYSGLISFRMDWLDLLAERQGEWKAIMKNLRRNNCRKDNKRQLELPLESKNRAARTSCRLSLKDIGRENQIL